VTISEIAQDIGPKDRKNPTLKRWRPPNGEVMLFGRFEGWAGEGNPGALEGAKMNLAYAVDRLIEVGWSLAD